MLWETRDFPEGHPYNNVVAMPNDVPLPPIWLLGSSDYSSQLAAQVGMGFAFAHHFASHDAVDAMVHYRARFKPSGWRAGAACDSRRRSDHGGDGCRGRAARLVSRSQPPAPRPRPICAAAECRGSAGLSLYRHRARLKIARNRSRLFVGSPSTVMAKLQPLIGGSQAG